MTNEANTNEAATATSAKVKTVLEHMDGRKLIDTPEGLINYLSECQTKFSDFDDAPKTFVGIKFTDEGVEIDETIYTEDMRFLVDVVTKRGAKIGNETGPSTLVTILVAPIPTERAIFETELGLNWLKKVAVSQLGNLSALPLRKAGVDIEDAVSKIPSTLENFFVSTRGSEAGSKVFATYAQIILQEFASKVPAIKRARITLPILRDCFASKAYALHHQAALEDRTKSIFVMMLESCITLAAKRGEDTSVFTNYLATRDAASLEEVDEEEIDLEALISGAVEKLDKADAKAATEQPAEGDAQPSA